jgi:hypothetical protein
MPYSELAYFEGYAFAHIAAFEERERLARKKAIAIAHRDRRSHRR